MVTPAVRKNSAAFSCKGSADRLIAERSFSWDRKRKLATYSEIKDAMYGDKNIEWVGKGIAYNSCLLYTSPSPRD